MTYRQARGTLTARHGVGTADWLDPARRGMGCDNLPLSGRPFAAEGSATEDTARISHPPTWWNLSLESR